MAHHEYPTLESTLTDEERRERIRRNRAIRLRHEWEILLRQLRWRGRGALLIALIGGAIGAFLMEILVFSPWPIGLTIRHYLASARCDAARAVGLAPARRGQPGYWPRLDADGDGIACEQLPRRWEGPRPQTAPDWEDPRSYNWQPWRRPN